LGSKTGVIGASALALSTYFYDLNEIQEQEKSF